MVSVFFADTVSANARQTSTCYYRVAKKMRTGFEMGTDTHRFFMFSIRNYLTSKVPSGGIYITVCSSDVCNIPTNRYFFGIFTVSA